jgi:glycosidase
MLLSYARSKATVFRAAVSVAVSVLAWALSMAFPAEAAPPKLKLHVPSPDWRDQIIYFLMTDRFEDGNPQNNDQGAGEFDPKQSARYSGGDLAGVQKRLNYIQGLGATAVWITPPVANQWWNGSYGGYHGYWASDFKRVDPHVGTLKDYQKLSDALHRRGMYLVQDIVLNHMGDFFSYKNAAPESTEKDPTQGYTLNAQSVPMKAPLQKPFNQNDPRNPEHRKAGIYHWTPDVVNYNDRLQELNYQMAGLDDLNSENSLVRRALRDSYGYWIRKVGVDAFRLDTAFYVPPEAIQDFLYAKDPKQPGMRLVAQQTGRKDFLTFGEGFGIDKAGETQQMKKIEAYVRDAKGAPVMQGMLNFPLYGSVSDVMARGHTTQELAERIRQNMQIHSDPHRMPSFLDNHDVDRFLKGGSELALRQSLALIMTLPGIPTLYYGTEQGFKEQRAAMFAKGYGSGGLDHFNQQAPLYTYTRSLTTLRKQHQVFSRGVPTILREDAAGPGVLAYRMDHGNQSAWVVFNTAEQPVLLDRLELFKGWQNTTKPAALKGVWGVEGAQFKRPTEFRMADTAADGHAVNLLLPPRSTQIWIDEGQPGTRSLNVANIAAKSKTELPQWPSNMPDKMAQDFELQGEWSLPQAATTELILVVNGQLNNAKAVEWLSPTQWHLRVDTSAWADASDQRLSLVVRDSKTRGVLAVSEPRFLRFEKQWTLVSEVVDPKGDDRGPLGTYVYPTDPSYYPGIYDIESMQVWRAQKSIRLKLKMGALSQSWNPANGFDHVVFTVFIGLPNGANSLQVMPMQQDQLPSGMHWHFRLRTHGWSNAMFSTKGASANTEGQPLLESAKLKVDAKAQTIQFDLPASLLSHLPDLKGLQIVVNTWDYDSGYRKLSQQGGTHNVGGGNADQPLWMDIVKIELNP